MSLLATALAHAQGDKPVAGFQLEILPRSFQRDPLVDVHVITEMTNAGRARPVPTAAAPVYYVAAAGGQRALGTGATADEKSVVPAQLEALLHKSLAASHHLPAPGDGKPAIVIVYSWGSHATPLGTNDAPRDADGTAAGGESQAMLMRDRIERARLVGGDNFAREYAKALDAESIAARAGQTSVFGLLGPLEKFRQRNLKTTAMLDDIAGSIYFLVASAYDATSVAKGERVLLWRTKMTTRSTGLNLAESMPALIVSGGPYFGREMSEAESIRRRLQRGASVDIGTPEVKGYDEAELATPPPEPAKK